MNGVSAEALIDTGSVDSFIRTDVAEETGLITAALEEGQYCICADGRKLATRLEVRGAEPKVGRWKENTAS